MGVFEMMVARPAGAQRVGPWWELGFYPEGNRKPLEQGRRLL